MLFESTYKYLSEGIKDKFPFSDPSLEIIISHVNVYPSSTYPKSILSSNVKNAEGGKTASFTSFLKSSVKI